MPIAAAVLEDIAVVSRAPPDLRAQAVSQWMQTLQNGRADRALPRPINPVFRQQPWAILRPMAYISTRRKVPVSEELRRVVP